MFVCNTIFNVSVHTTKTKWSMVTWADILCFITSAVRCVKYSAIELQIYQTKGFPKRHITCCCICKIWVKRRGPVISKNCCVETALEMSGCSKMWDIWTDLCLFQTETAGSVPARPGVLVSLQKNALDLFDFPTKYPDREVYTRCCCCFSREGYIKFRFGRSPILIHRLRYRNDIIPRGLIVPCMQGWNRGWVACSFFV